MDAIRCIDEFNRMCNHYYDDGDDDIRDCPVYAKIDEIYDCGCSYCEKYIRDNPVEFVQIVESWSKDNPVVTNNMKFKETFGFDFRSLMFENSAARTLWLNKPYKPVEDKSCE